MKDKLIELLAKLTDYKKTLDYQKEHARYERVNNVIDDVLKKIMETTK